MIHIFPQLNKAEFLRFGQNILGFVVVIAIWQLTVITLENRMLFPSPLSTLNSLIDIALEPHFLNDFLATISRMLIGLLLSITAGIAVGYFIGSFKFLKLISEGVVDFFRSIPVTSIYPIFVLFFGIDHLSKIAMVFWACFFIIVLNTVYGISMAQRTKTDVAKLFGASAFQIFTKVTFYQSLPQVLIGIRIAISYALIVEILCEMFMGSSYGIGQRITEAFVGFEMSDLFALVIVSGIIGFSLNKIFEIIENNTISWS